MWIDFFLCGSLLEEKETLKSYKSLRFERKINFSKKIVGKITFHSKKLIDINNRIKK